MVRRIHRDGVPDDATFETKIATRRWTPYASGPVSVGVCVLLWLAQLTQERAHLREQVDVAANVARRQLAGQIGTIDQTLRRVARSAAVQHASPDWQKNLVVFQRDASWPRQFVVIGP